MMTRVAQQLLRALFGLLLLTPVTAAGAADLFIQHERLHTALIVKREMVYQAAPELKKLNLPASKYIRFGWGDSRYYGNPNRHSGAGFQALFLPTSAVMEVTPIIRVEQLPGVTLQIPATAEQIATLIAQISASFHPPDPEYGYPLIRTALYGQHYFPARGTYHLFNNCNHWTIQRLQFLDINTSRFNSVFASSVMRQLGAHAVPLHADSP